MKSKLILFSGVLILVAILFVGAFVWWKTNTAPVSDESSKIRVVIPKGYGAGQIANLLEEENVVKNAFAFKFYAQLTGKAQDIQAGEYTLDPSMSTAKILQDLTSGPDLLWVTVPEGLRREEIPVKYAQSLGYSVSETNQFAEMFLSESANLEGYLFPDTYLVPKDITPTKAVSLMNNTFESKFSELVDVNSDKSRVTIIASLIEREAKSIEERPGIAGVIENRLGLGMPLQIDATVQYALANSRCASYDCDWWKPPLKADLEIDSAYNTYVNIGLPPAPISNPGIASLTAAANPTSHNYLYYIHDDNAQIHFSETLEEHNQNVQRYLR